MVRRSLLSKRTSALAAARGPARNSSRRWTSARIRFVVNSAARWASAVRNAVSASAWCGSRALTSASQAPLSTNSLPGTPRSRLVPCGLLGNERLRQITVELRAEIGGQSVDHSAGTEQRIVAAGPRQRADGESHRLRFRPATLAGPALEPLEVGVIEVDLQRPRHDRQ